MAATTLYQTVGGTLQSCRNNGNSGLCPDYGRVSLRLMSKGFKVDVGLLRGGSFCSRKRSTCVIQASGSQAMVFDEASASSSATTSDSKNKTSEAALILIRHGESMWNEKNLFTGCVDVPLTTKGVEEAVDAGKRISNIPIDMIYTSSLIRAQMTAMLALTQHRCKKVPTIIHEESEQAGAWSQIFSEETIKQCIPVVTAWQLNERMYGELQGLNKQETADKYGQEQVHEWRRSYDIPPPNGESLEMCAERAVAYFKEHIEPQLAGGKNLMIAAHGNSLRSIIMYLDKLTSQEVISLELATGIPMLYIFKDGRFIRRGSPPAPSEAGVYAYTSTLAQYRQNLDDMFGKPDEDLAVS
ncbi:2,3-bisphosphoglycerate-dependent phosphoglycerate mutase 1 [Capsicum chacoense]|uniref:2,3-bisphosphoglycerate-dependent phosphoglycerate mutase 1 n=1 Tax=Capsicum annuum TaxID=4072 RepID=UPI0007BF80FA|nr:2,3-bisphosphoglycerate-dependent phosphoglycerate mutase 1 [Capsicum annuum]